MSPKNRPTRGRQRLSGEGTISGPRKDGRYVGAFYAVTGIASYLYSGREPFWLLFLFQGVIVIGTTLAFRSLSHQR